MPTDDARDYEAEARKLIVGLSRNRLCGADQLRLAVDALEAAHHRGREAGMRAAREAVERVPFGSAQHRNGKLNSLAAIDRLIEQEQGK